MKVLECFVAQTRVCIQMMIILAIHLMFALLKARPARSVAILSSMIAALLAWGIAIIDMVTSCMWLIASYVMPDGENYQYYLDNHLENNLRNTDDAILRFPKIMKVIKSEV